MRAPSRVHPQPVELVAGPFRGMRDAPETTTADPTLALYVGNMVRTPGPPNGGLVSRPGFAGMSTSAGGSVGFRTTQALLTWTDVNGARITVRVVGGRIETYDWNTSTWTNSVTAANLTTAAITLSATAKIALVPFADGLIVSDGVNRAFTWNGTAGAAGLAVLPVGCIFYGPPTVRDARLVGIRLLAGLRSALIWSEPGTALVGYDVAGYNNAWDNPGGYADPMTAVCGTNEALYVFRERVSLAIVGNVVADWQTAGTKANLSERIGTLSPWAVYAVTQGVVIVDADAKPWLMRYGFPEPMPLWADCAQTILGTPRASLAACETVHDEAAQTLWIGIPEVGQTAISALLGFAFDDLQFVGVASWGATVQRVGRVVDANGVGRWAHAGLGDGRCYVHGTLADGPWDDALQGGTLYITHSVIGTTLGYDLDREIVFTEIEAAETGGGASALSVSYETPRGQSVSMSVAITSGITGATWDVSNWDAADWSATTRDQRVRVGIAGRGRWIRPKVSHAMTGESFAVTLLRVRGHSSAGNPKEP